MSADAPTDKIDEIGKKHQSIKDAQLDSPGKSPAPGEQKAKSSADTKILEDKATLPHVRIGGQPAVSKGKSAAETKEWTVAIDLASTLPGDRDKPEGWGAENQLAQLKLLARATEGKPVNFVVHAELFTDGKGKPCASFADDKRAACVKKADAGSAGGVGSDGSAGSVRTKTGRFLIHDGEIEELPDGKYKNGASGITGLLEDAKKLAPSEKLGLIIQSHGMGDDGIATNSGPVALEKVIDSISKGLKGSGHDKLDLLDFDSCDMASAKVLESAKKVANDVVASAAAEGVGKSSDGQNLSTALQGLLNNTNMSGKDLGESIVNQAKAGVDGRNGENSIPTLANFDMSKFDDFKQSMDKFGTALSTSAKSAENAKLLMKEVDDTIVPESGGPEELSHNRDVKDFANKVLADIRVGKFTGDTKALESATRDFVKKFDSLATAQYGDPVAGYEKLGGMQTYMPGGEVYDSKFMSEQRDPLHKLSMLIKTQNRDNLEFSDKDSMAGATGQSVKDLDYHWAKAHPGEYKQIKEAQEAIKKTTDLASLQKALTHLQELADQVDAGPAGADMRKHLLDGAKLDQRDYARMPVSSISPGWDSFLAAMKSHSS